MPTPAEEEAFTRSIVARFRDDGPRLVFADYLDDSPHPADRHRAEFIRLQLALARLPDDHPRRGDLVERENELRLRHADEWTRHLKGLADGYEFRRGIVDSVTVNVAQFAARGEELFRRAAVRRVRITDAGSHVHRLIHLPVLAQVRELGLCGADLGNGGLNVLLRSPHLGHVEALDLSFNGLCDAGVWRLAECSGLPSLAALHLNDNGLITASGVKRLAESPHFGGLRVLDLSANDVGDAGVSALAHSYRLARLHTLRLRNNHIGDAGCEALAGSPLLARLLARDPRLDLRQNSITSAGLKALAACPQLAGVRVLDLSHNYIGDDGLETLADSPHATALHTLLLRQNPITDVGAVLLARSELMTRLVRLDVSSNGRIGRRGIDELWKRRRDFHTVIECDGPPAKAGGPG
ncbi:MAG: TIGR02996 domain-containing protein [Fimbriiglobus sp.]|jgi:uncharacterized protein (TIGR02996 family)|nr:TIGR02996 domain-containing protein [Fimbriiglobus sp.]